MGLPDRRTFGLLDFWTLGLSDCWTFGRRQVAKTLFKIRKHINVDHMWENDGMVEDFPPEFIHFLDTEEQGLLRQEFPDKEKLPKYLLPERTKVEEAINDLYSRYEVPEEAQLELDGLIFAYEKAVAGTISAYERWGKERGKTKYDVHPLLQLELPEIMSLQDQLHELEKASRNLTEFLQGDTVQVKGNPKIPEWMASWYKKPAPLPFSEVEN